MTIEEKAKRYDESLKVLHKYDGANIMFSQSLKEEMFPELKESNGERIRKALNKIVPKFKVGQTIKKKDFNLGFTIVKIEDGFYYNDKGDYFPFTDEDNWELVEQKPAWSEEDEDILNTIINHFKVDIECTDEDDMVRWLKHLKERYTWKPSDEQMDAFYTYLYNPQYIDNSDDYRLKLVISLYEQLKKLSEK